MGVTESHLLALLGETLAGDDAEWMPGKSRTRLAPGLDNGFLMDASVDFTNVTSLGRKPFKQQGLATLSQQCHQATQDSPVYRVGYLSFQGHRLGREKSIASKFIERHS